MSQELCKLKKTLKKDLAAYTLLVRPRRQQEEESLQPRKNLANGRCPLNKPVARVAAGLR